MLKSSMIAVTAVGWAVTFIISLVFILTKFDSKMLLLQGKGIAFSRLE